jgi:hypothetical protein
MTDRLVLLRSKELRSSDRPTTASSVLSAARRWMSQVGQNPRHVLSSRVNIVGHYDIPQRALSGAGP